MLSRLTKIALLATFLCACSTTTKPAASTPAPMTRVVTGLGAQTLAPMECGLFGWETSSNPDFVFFATPDRALYMSSDEASETLLPNGPFPAEDYGPYQLTLGNGEPLIDGTRYPSARITEILPDGFTRVRPLVILQTCQNPSRAGN